ncbi:YSIRK-type signal peptide-containing protein [Staphylococcus equorum]|uniref:YSIRK-type signal peptide-containing protein n=1 Tax=Staphylococcus equorum TaxID=246432 RepID=UPI00298209DF|nr:YSIRK-type signal peptide-containing protein [Staphylococcus equorum]MDW5470499.1 YSIRK-type signal peptide-containing protein [Staphylococcus equorum]
MKNNHDLTPNRKNKYSIRKLSVGTASLLVGSVLVFGLSNDANAAENDLPKDSKALNTNVNEDDNHLVDTEKANSNEQEPVNDFSKSHDIQKDNLKASHSASEQSIVQSKPTANNTNEIDTSNKEAEVAVNTNKSKVTDNKENNNNATNVIEKENTVSKPNKTNEENSEIVKTENKLKADNKANGEKETNVIEKENKENSEIIKNENKKVNNVDDTSLNYEERQTSDVAKETTINQSEAQSKQTRDVNGYIANNTRNKLKAKDEVNTQREITNSANANTAVDRSGSESARVLNTNESNNNVAKVRSARSVIIRKKSARAMTEDSSLETLDYSDNYTFQTLIFDPSILTSNEVLNGKTIPFEIHSYLTGANSGDRYKINLQLDPVIANHVTRITVNPAGRTSPVDLVRLSNKQGKRTNIWQVNFIRANGGLFGGAEILS